MIAGNDKRVAMLTIMTGKTAKVLAPGDLDTFDLDHDAVPDSDMLIVVTELTCDRDDVEACVTLGL